MISVIGIFSSSVSFSKDKTTVLSARIESESGVARRDAVVIADFCKIVTAELTQTPRVGEAVGAQGESSMQLFDELRAIGLGGRHIGRIEADIPFL